MIQDAKYWAAVDALQAYSRKKEVERLIAAHDARKAKSNDPRELRRLRKNELGKAWKAKKKAERAGLIAPTPKPAKTPKPLRPCEVHQAKRAAYRAARRGIPLLASGDQGILARTNRDTHGVSGTPASVGGKDSAGTMPGRTP